MARRNRSRVPERVGRVCGPGRSRAIRFGAKAELAILQMELLGCDLGIARTFAVFQQRSARETRRTDCVAESGGFEPPIELLVL
jgi:hypothetical protein